MATKYGNNNGNGHRPGTEKTSEPGGQFKQKKRLERLEAQQTAETRTDIKNLIEHHQRALGGWVNRTAESEEKSRGFGK